MPRRSRPRPAEHALDCHYCGRQLTKDRRTWDHIVPLALDGPNYAWNKVTSCQPCNQKKADKDTWREHCPTCAFAWWMVDGVDESAWGDDAWLLRGDLG